MISPVCAPPWMAADFSAACSAWYRRSTSSGRRLLTGAAGEILACQSVSSASRFPTPAILDWSSSRALTAIVPLLSRLRNSSGVTSSASGPRPPISGVSRTRPSRRLSNKTSRPPSANSIVKRFHSDLPGPRPASRLQAGCGSPAWVASPPGAMITMLPLMPR